MIRVDLSSLSRVELRRLLESARARGQTALEQQVLAQLNAPQAPETPRVQPARPVQPALPDIVYAPVARAAARPRRGAMAGLAVATGGALALLVGWGVTLPPTAPTAPQAPASRVAMARVTLASTAATATAEPMPPMAGLLPAPAADAPQAVATNGASRAALLKANPCYGKPTPAERLTCGFPALAAQERLVRQAYERALANGGDPAALSAAQDEWRERHAQTWDRAELSQAFAQRLRELEAAAPSRPAEPPPS